MINILIDCNGIEIIQENLSYFLSIKDKANFYINATVIEELANMCMIKKERFISDETNEIMKKIEQHNQKIEKYKRNLLALFELSPQFVTDAVFLLGHSRLGCARLGNCTTYDKLLGNSKHYNDSIIGASAFYDNHFVLTNDTRFRNKMKNTGVKYLNFEELQQIIESIK